MKRLLEDLDAEHLLGAMERDLCDSDTRQRTPTNTTLESDSRQTTPTYKPLQSLVHSQDVSLDLTPASHDTTPVLRAPRGSSPATLPCSGSLSLSMPYVDTPPPYFTAPLLAHDTPTESDDVSLPSVPSFFDDSDTGYDMRVSDVSSEAGYEIDQHVPGETPDFPPRLVPMFHVEDSTSGPLLSSMQIGDPYCELRSRANQTLSRANQTLSLPFRLVMFLPVEEGPSLGCSWEREVETWGTTVAVQVDMSHDMSARQELQRLDQETRQAAALIEQRVLCQ